MLILSLSPAGVMQCSLVLVLGKAVNYHSPGCLFSSSYNFVNIRHIASHRLKSLSLVLVQNLPEL